MISGINMLLIILTLLNFVLLRILVMISNSTRKIDNDFYKTEVKELEVKKKFAGEYDYDLGGSVELKTEKKPKKKVNKRKTTSRRIKR